MLESLLSKITLEFLGSIASIVSLVFSIVVYVNINKLRAQFMFKGRVTQLHRQLDSHVTQLRAYVRNYDNSLIEIDTEIGLTEVDLKSLESKVTGKLRSSTKDVINKIKRLKNKSLSDNNNKESIDKIIIDITMLVREIKNVIEDMKWE